VTGSLTYVDHGAGIKLKATSFSSLNIAGNTATFTGACGTGCTFSVYVEDNGEPGTNDVFRISINGGAFQGGQLRSGNIQLHK
jgi:hypothetical protein